MNVPFITMKDGNPEHLDLTLTRAKFEELIADLTRLRGVYVVAPDGVTVVSAYRASRRRVKRQLAKARSSVV